jgi:hypothetical protein
MEIPVEFRFSLVMPVVVKLATLNCASVKLILEVGLLY